MNTLLKKNFALVMGITLPIIIVVFFLLASALPRFFVAAPTHDFLFTDQEYEYDEQDNPEVKFTIKNERLHATVRKDKNRWHSRLYRYEHESKTIREIEVVIHDDMRNDEVITIPETTQLKISLDNTSPDGYEFAVDRRRGGGLIGELFYSPRRDNIVLSKNGNRVSIPTPNNAYSNYAKLLGWVIEQEKDNG